MDTQRIQLAAGDLSAEIVPTIGGALAAFDVGDFPLLRPELRSGPFRGRPLGMACFPMLPFANRISCGRFEHDGRTLEIRGNVDEPHPLHGHGWQTAWDVDSCDRGTAVLAFRSSGLDWPWPYEAFQAFALTAVGLTVTLGVRNLGTQSFPVSLGLHPYIARGSDATLEARCNRIWAKDDSGIPTEPQVIPAAWDFSAPRQAAGTGLDHCFDGWDGHATVRWPDHDVALRLEADGCGFLQVYAPAGQDCFCIEPMTSRPDAFNPRPGDLAGPILVEPGRSATMAMRLHPVTERLPPRA